MVLIKIDPKNNTSDMTTELSVYIVYVFIHHTKGTNIFNFPTTSAYEEFLKKTKIIVCKY